MPACAHAQEVRELLRGHQCIETEAGEMRRPAECLVRQGLPVSVLSNDDLLQATGLEFAKAIGDGAVEDLLKLGCKRVTPAVVCTCLESGKLVPAIVRRPQAWFWGVFEYLLQHLHDARLLDRVFCLPIFRVSNSQSLPANPSALAAARGPEGGRGPAAPAEMVALAQSPVFLSLPADVSASAIGLCVLCDEEGRAVACECGGGSEAVEAEAGESGGGLAADGSRRGIPDKALKLLARLGVEAASEASIVDAIVEQHWVGAFASLEQVWHGLCFLKRHLPHVLRLRAAQESRGGGGSTRGRVGVGRGRVGALAAEVRGVEGKREPLYLRGIGEPAETLRELRAALWFE